MRLVLLSETFSKKMGYLQNTLPKYLARLGVDVHVVTMNLPPYYQISGFDQTYGKFTGSDELVPGSIEPHDGYTLHVLGHKRLLGYMRMVGLTEKLRSLRPDIVQTSSSIGWIAQDAALGKLFLGYKLFTGSHTTASVFPLANNHVPRLAPARLRCLATRTLPGFLVSLASEKCYGATSDCADVAVNFFGVQHKKIAVSTLGVDTDIFIPISGEKERIRRDELRGQLGFSDADIVCVYSGRFSADKNPLLLAKAVSRLHGMGESFKGLFMGGGEQATAIAEMPGCVAHPFVPFQELAKYFQASDIGVWPTQESMSMLDAAACGLTIVVNNTLVARERIDGNGVTYNLNDLDDLVRVLLSLRNPEKRRHLGSHGAEKMATTFSWETIARGRIADYKAVLSDRDFA
jgi:glycosyltransferase involved in cell wall biosynthesis